MTSLLAEAFSAPEKVATGNILFDTSPEGKWQPKFSRMNQPNAVVYFDISISGKPVGRIVIEVRQDICPRGEHVMFDNTHI